MTKAKKSLIITLFAAMMMFAFGATSVFADGEADSVTWSDDFKTVTVSLIGGGSVDVKADLAFNNGITTATVPTIAGVDMSRIPSADTQRYFFDLTGATVEGLGTAYEYSAYTALAGAAPNDGTYPYQVKLVKPEGATGPDDYTISSQYFNGYYGNAVRWDINLSVDADVALPASAAPITAVFTAHSSRQTDFDGTSVQYPKKVGADPVAKVQVVADPLVAKAWYQDVAGVATRIIGTTDANTGLHAHFTYDAAKHIAYVPSESGYAIQYQQYDEPSGTWNNVEEVAWRDATATPAYYRAVLYPTEPGKLVQAPTRLTIDYVSAYTADTPSFDWTPSNNWDLNDMGDYILTKEQAADPMALIVFDGPFAADMDEVVAYFKDAYTVDVVKSAADPNKQEWTISTTDAALADAAAKHPALVNNYSIALTGLDDNSEPIMVEVRDAAVVDPDTAIDTVDFTFAPTTKTYHVKKAKKLKKAKSFTVEAVAKSGNAVEYVLKTPSKKITIDKATGKITVKKGIKKGTYKIKVTARSIKGNGFASAQDVANITIKIKK